MNRLLPIRNMSSLRMLPDPRRPHQKHNRRAPPLQARQPGRSDKKSNNKRPRFGVKSVPELISGFSKEASEKSSKSRLFGGKTGLWPHQIRRGGLELNRIARGFYNIAGATIGTLTRFSVEEDHNTRFYRVNRSVTCHRKMLGNVHIFL